MEKRFNRYINSSQIDYLSHFGQAWIGFNTWYGNPNSRVSEWNQIKDAANDSPMRFYFESKLFELKNIDPFIVKEVENLSKCICNDYTYSLDTTCFQFRSQCANTNCFTMFLQVCF